MMTRYSISLVLLLLISPPLFANEEGSLQEAAVAKVTLFGFSEKESAAVATDEEIGTAVGLLFQTPSVYWFPVGSANPRATPVDGQDVPATTMADFLKATRECCLHIRWGSPLLLKDQDGEEVGLSEAVLGVYRDEEGRRLPSSFFGVSTSGQVVVIDRCDGHFLMTQVVPLLNAESNLEAAP